ncbi:MAG: nucleoside triphosphate pyrophosphohydrolase [Verrucomicrobiota bacterium]
MENLNGVPRLREIVARLRAPDGCPWDREQTHSSLRALLVEECHEVIDAIERSDDANLREELGDLLLHVVMHAQMAEERGAFDLDHVAAEVCEKMIRRHPHVFGDSAASDSEEVLRQWDAIKRKEKGADAGALDGVATSLPALLRAQTLQKKAARVGFDWPDAEPVFAKLEEEAAEIREAVACNDPAAVESEIGDLLFSAVNLARKLGVDAETALAGANKRFASRFQRIEETLRAEGRRVEDTPLEELDQIWEQAKQK